MSGRTPGSYETPSRRTPSRRGANDLSRLAELVDRDPADRMRTPASGGGYPREATPHESASGEALLANAMANAFYNDKLRATCQQQQQEISALRDQLERLRVETENSRHLLSTVRDNRSDDLVMLQDENRRMLDLNHTAQKHAAELQWRVNALEVDKEALTRRLRMAEESNRRLGGNATGGGASPEQSAQRVGESLAVLINRPDTLSWDLQYDELRNVVLSLARERNELAAAGAALRAEMTLVAESAASVDRGASSILAHESSEQARTLAAHIAEREAMVSEWLREKESLLQQQDALRAHMQQELQETADAWRAEIERVRGEYESQIAQINKDYAYVRERNMVGPFTTLESSHTELRDKHSALTQVQAELSAAYKALERERSELSERLTVATASAERAQTELATRRTEATVAAARLEELEVAHRHAEDELSIAAAVRARVRSIEEENSSLRQEKRALIDEKTRLEEKINNLTRNCEALTLQASTLSAAVTQLDANSTQLNRENAVQQEQFAQAAAQRAGMAQELAALQDEHFNVTTRLQQELEEKAQLQTALNMAIGELGASRKEAETLRNACHKLEADLEATRQQFQQDTTEIVRGMQGLQSMARVDDEAKSQLREENSNLAGLYEQAQAKLRGMRSEVSEARTAATAAQTEARGLAREKATAERNAATLRQEVDAAKKAARDLEIELRTTRAESLAIKASVQTAETAQKDTSLEAQRWRHEAQLLTERVALLDAERRASDEKATTGLMRSAQLEEVLRTAEARCAQLDREVGDAALALRSAEDKIGEWADANAGLKDELEASRATAAGLVAERTALIDVRRGLQRDLDAARAAHTSVQTAHEDALALATKQREDVARINAALVACRTQCEQLKGELEREGFVVTARTSSDGTPTGLVTVAPSQQRSARDADRVAQAEDHRRAIAEVQRLGELLTATERERAALLEERAGTARAMEDATLAMEKKSLAMVEAATKELRAQLDETIRTRAADVEALADRLTATVAATTKERTDMIQEQAKRYQGKIDTLVRGSKAEMDELIRQHASEIEALTTRATDEGDALRKRHKQELADLHAQRRTQIESLKKAHEAELADAVRRRSDEFEDNFSSHRHQMEEAHRHLKAELEAAERRHKMEASQLSAALVAAETRYTEVRAKLTSELQQAKDSSEASKANERVKEIENDMAETREALTVALSEREALESTLVNVQSESARVYALGAAENAGLKEANKLLASEIEVLTGSLNDISAACGQLRGELTSLKQEYNRLQADHIAVTTQLAEREAAFGATGGRAAVAVARENQALLENLRRAEEQVEEARRETENMRRRGGVDTQRGGRGSLMATAGLGATLDRTSRARRQVDFDEMTPVRDRGDEGRGLDEMDLYVGGGGAELANLQGTVRTLQMRLNQTADQKDALEDQLRREVQRLTAEARATQTEVTRMQSENNQLSAKADTLNSEKAALQAEVSQLKAAANTTKNELRRAVEATNAATSRATDLASRLSAMEDGAGATHSDAMRALSLQGELRRQQDAGGRMQSDMLAAQAAARAARAEADEARESARQEVARLHQSHVLELSAAKGELLQLRASLELELRQRERERDDVQGMYNQLVAGRLAEIDEIMTQANALVADNTELSTRAQALQRELADKDRGLQAVADEMRLIEDERVKMAEFVALVQTESATLRNQAMRGIEAQKERDALVSTLEGATKELERLRQASTAANTSTPARESLAAQLEAERKEREAERAASIERAKTVSIGHQTELNALYKQLEELNRRVATVASDAEQTRLQAAKAAEEYILKQNRLEDNFMRLTGDYQAAVARAEAAERGGPRFEPGRGGLTGYGAGAGYGAGTGYGGGAGYGAASTYGSGAGYGSGVGSAGPSMGGDAENRIRDLERELALARARLAERDAAVAALERSLKEEQMNVGQLTEALARAHTEPPSLSNSGIDTQLRFELAALRDENTKMRAQEMLQPSHSAALERDVATMRADLLAARASEDSLGRQVNRLLAENAALQARLSSPTPRGENAGGDVSEMRNVMLAQSEPGSAAGRAPDLAALTGDLDALRAHNAQLQARLAEATSSPARLTTPKVSAAEEMEHGAGTLAQSDELGNLLASLQRTGREWMDVLLLQDHILGPNYKEADAVARLAGTVAQQKTLNQRFQSTLDKAANVLHAMQNGVDMQAKLHRDEVAGLHAQIDNLRSEVAFYEEEVENISQKMVFFMQRIEEEENAAN